MRLCASKNLSKHRTLYYLLAHILLLHSYVRANVARCRNQRSVKLPLFTRASLAHSGGGGGGGGWGCVLHASERAKSYCERGSITVRTTTTTPVSCSERWWWPINLTGSSFAGLTSRCWTLTTHLKLKISRIET